MQTVTVTQPTKQLLRRPRLSEKDSLAPVVQSRQARKTEDLRKTMPTPEFARQSVMVDDDDGGDLRALLLKQPNSGPNPLFPRKPVRNAMQLSNLLRLLEEETESRYVKQPEFTLNDFVRQMSNVTQVPSENLHLAMLSRHTYTKIVDLVRKRIFPRNLQPLKAVDLNEKLEEGLNESVEGPAASARIPHAQLMFEIASLLKQQVQELFKIDVKCEIRKMKKYAPNYDPNDPPLAEIVLYQVDTDTDEKRIAQRRVRDEDLLSNRHPHLLSSPPTAFFSNGPRTSSPFQHDDSTISPLELAVIDAVFSGGQVLSFKAHFLSSLPDISILSDSLTYLNLSFNNFVELPDVILLLRNLEVLKLRDNPLHRLPEHIEMLSQLRVLTVSYCMLSALPVSLYRCTKLLHLDVAYNKLSFIHSEIQQLQNLKELDLTGNELTYLPAGLLRVRLEKLRVKNNMLHPLFWKETIGSASIPQRLIDLASLSCWHYFSALYEKGDKQQAAEAVSNLSSDVRRQIFHEADRCDFCDGPRFGFGLRLLRPCGHFATKRQMPFLFRTCSSSCAAKFKNVDILEFVRNSSAQSPSIGQPIG